MSEQEIFTNEETGITAEIPARNAADHLPTREGWKVLLGAIFYTAFAALLLALVITALTQPGGVNGFGWFIVALFLLGVAAAAYSAIDDFRQLKAAFKLDKSGVDETVAIADDWVDQYVDGGVATRKDHYHIIYLYANGQQYAKHTIRKSDAESLRTTTRIKVRYLPENPKAFRMLSRE